MLIVLLIELITLVLPAEIELPRVASKEVEAEVILLLIELVTAVLPVEIAEASIEYKEVEALNIVAL